MSENKIRKPLAILPFSLRAAFSSLFFQTSSNINKFRPFFLGRTRKKIVSIFSNEKWNIINFCLAVNCLFISFASSYFKQVIYSILVISTVCYVHCSVFFYFRFFFRSSFIYFVQNIWISKLISTKSTRHSTVFVSRFFFFPLGTFSLCRQANDI